ncbi:hypothetical protein G3I77_23030 [Streptomyces sp. D2-8]|uniref:hypothetical protein n=1 Tax=Streptomyces sp. D2-8 TaxID=2707767 RepID=UPI0035B1DF09|nr:hypothetical protein [Streptomyces sp. D2-8]
MFVDNSGRRARLLRRIGLLLGAVCLGYAAVLGAAFMGWRTSLTPSQLLIAVFVLLCGRVEDVAARGKPRLLPGGGTARMGP